MSNAVYGKTTKNLRNKIDVRLITSKPSQISQNIFDNDLLHIYKSKTILDACIVYCIMWILDLSQVLMYKFHYDHIKDKDGKNSIILFTDTDSLMY